MDETKEFAFHNDCITEFNTELYANIFTEENITSKKKAIKIGVNPEPFYGFYLEKGREVYFVLDNDSKELPFKIVESEETDYKGEVFKIITRVCPITIPAEKRMSFRELVNKTPSFKHTNQYHFLLYKIIAIASHMDRVNYRVSTGAGFGKDSVVSIISQLVDSTANLYGATFAKLEFVLMNNLIILNELGNLKKDEKINMQEFLLAVGAYFNTYTKRTRRTNTTQEQYDVSKLSLIIFYNLPEYYRNKAQEYFDQMFTKAVINRFIPFVFEGQLTTAFDTVIDSHMIMEKNRALYKDVIATLNYFKENKLNSIKYVVDKSVIKFSDELMRYERTFNTLLKYVAEYADSQEEFDGLSKELFRCYKNYDKLLLAEEEELR